jgi:ubiquitin-conjugating enzyme E2 S
MRELKDLEKNPPEGIRVQTSEEDILDVTGIIEGPGESSFFLFWEMKLNGSARTVLVFSFKEGTPYAGGYFKVKFRFTNEFPAVPPKCMFFFRLLFRLGQMVVQVGSPPKFSIRM